MVQSSWNINETESFHATSLGLGQVHSKKSLNQFYYKVSNSITLFFALLIIDLTP